MKDKSKAYISILVAMLLLAGGSVYADTSGFEHSSKGYYVVFEKGTEDEVFATSWEVDIGDRYHSTDNKMYQVVEVDRDGKKAYARFVEDVEMPEIDEIFVTETMQTARTQKQVALYFSHNAESYVPTDGTDSKPGRGGIVEVGEAFKKGFENSGLNPSLIRIPMSHTMPTPTCAPGGPPQGCCSVGRMQYSTYTGMLYPRNTILTP